MLTATKVNHDSLHEVSQATTQHPIHTGIAPSKPIHISIEWKERVDEAEPEPPATNKHQQPIQPLQHIIIRRRKRDRIEVHMD
ncbi:hypothetical protein HBH98_203040 [Parastagonospora nodorum]|nr:hypothetical protein HBI06_070780 [Parastagonospora nodorum]KAH4246785.1 hypothetical protein HBI05_054000 [Parastagonospora nodorum]KAH4339721.1 hypothetical protein HBH98_203040 [Parastagonospora nodorum]KAH6032925.1 hypothetical protein HBI83_018130 [Parastagonospora nodorum]